MYEKLKNYLSEEKINEKLLDNFKNKIKNDKTIKGYEKFFNIQNSLINEAKNELIFNKKLITNNNLVSRLTFGFWNRLFNKKYDGILWNKYLYKIFNKKINRQNVEEILELFRVFRNRIAHNECIINRELTVLRYYDEIINFVNLIDNEICNWLKKQMSRTLFE